MEALAQPLAYSPCRERPDTGGGKLDCKRKLIDGLADVAYVFVQLEAGTYGRCSLDEERDSVRARHRRHLVDAFRPKTETLTAGRDDDKGRTAVQEVPYQFGNPRDEMFAVVDDDECALPDEGPNDRIRDRDPWLFAHPERLGERGFEARRVAQRRQRDPEDARRKSIGDLGRTLEHESRLSASSGTSEGDEPGRFMREKLDNLLEFALASEERRRGNREVRLVEALKRRELGAAELKNALTCAQVLESVSPRSTSSMSTSGAVVAETSTCPPWPASAMRAARCTSWPT